MYLLVFNEFCVSNQCKEYGTYQTFSLFLSYSTREVLKYDRHSVYPDRQFEVSAILGISLRH